LESIDVFVTGDKDFSVFDIDMPEFVAKAKFLEAY